MQIDQILKIIITCFMSTFLMTFVVKKIAFHIGALDYPNGRKIHKNAMPRLGGVAIFSGFLLRIYVVWQ